MFGMATAAMRPHTVALTSRTSSNAGLRTLPRGTATAAPARGRRRSARQTHIQCYTYRGGESESRDDRDSGGGGGGSGNNNRRKRRDEGQFSASPPLKANRAFLSDPFCTVAEDSEGLPGLICPAEPDEAPELGPTFRYVEWDFTEEHGRGGHRQLCADAFDGTDEEDDKEDGEEEEDSGGGDDAALEECDVSPYDLTFAAKMAEAKGLQNNCTVGEDEDGMPALDCPMPSRR